MARMHWIPGCVVLLLSGQAAFADAYIEHALPTSQTPAKTWTSGLKERKEIEAPFLGRQVTITRVDKGVEWTLNPKKKTYEEKPIALPYDKPNPHPASAYDDSDTGMDDTADDDTCTFEMKKLPSGRTVAGYEAVGYRMGCREEPKEGMIVWLAASGGIAQSIHRDVKKYNQAHGKALYANYPAKERKEMEQGMAAMWQNILGEMPRQANLDKVPDNLPMAMETESREVGKMTFYEVIRLSAAPISASLFEIPAGYTKIDGKASGFGSGKMNMDELMKAMENLAPKQ